MSWVEFLRSRPLVENGCTSDLLKEISREKLVGSGGSRQGPGIKLSKGVISVESNINLTPGDL